MTPTERADAIDLAKRRVESCIEDYRLALLAYAEWMAKWKARPKQEDAA